MTAVGPDVVYHLGGHVTAAPDIDNVVPAFESLLASTVHVLRCATEQGVRRVVLAASSTEPRPPGETPGSPYAAAKWCANAYAHMFHALYGTPVVVTRPFWTYGPGQRGTKLVPYVIHALLQGQAPRLASGALQVDWVYVDDVIDGLLRAATVERAVGEEIELGSGQLVSVREIVRRIVDIVRPAVEPTFGALPDRPAEEVRAAELERAWTLLGWRPTTSLEAGLARTVAWHRQQREAPGARRHGG
jgi:nucleoside-diphosphate-sugar epimerase